MKFLFFDTGSDDTGIFNADNLQMIDQNGDGTVLMVFTPGGISAGNTKSATVTLNVTSGKEMDCLRDLARSIAHGRGALITIADDTNSIYASQLITSCGAIALTA